MLNGLYLASFERGSVTGRGVTVIHDARVLGGDGTHWWEGRIDAEAQRFAAELTVHKHSDGPSVFGFFSFTIISLMLSGERAGDHWRAKATASISAEVPLWVSLYLLTPA